MSKFIRAANCHFQHHLVGKTEKIGDDYARIHDNFPNSLSYSELMGVDFLAGEPAVGKQVLEEDASLDGGPHHVHRKRDIVLVVLGEALANGIVSIALGCVSGVKFLLGHLVVLLAALLSNESEVKQHLGNTVRDAEEESLPLVVNPAELLNCHACQTR